MNSRKTSQSDSGLSSTFPVSLTVHISILNNVTCLVNLADNCCESNVLLKIKLHWIWCYLKLFAYFCLCIIYYMCQQFGIHVCRCIKIQLVNSPIIYQNIQGHILSEKVLFKITLSLSLNVDLQLRKWTFVTYKLYQ